jgi:ribonuclease HII
LVVGAVVLGDTEITGLTDSKKLTKRRREQLASQILGSAAVCGLGWVEAAEIDEIGLSASLALATRRALEQIHVPYHEIIIDGTVNFLKDTQKGRYVTTMKKADLLITAVSAASIIAKVARDDYMERLADDFPEYGFESHVGYGTARHREALQKYGVTPHHRKSFAPVAGIIGKAPAQPVKNPLTNKATGFRSEAISADWLEANGYQIVEQNWKTRFCEIDIIARREDRLVFVEVKHRRGSEQGGGVAAITPTKLRQMTFAARLYLSKYPQMSAQLGVITTHGDPEVVTSGLLLLE